MSKAKTGLGRELSLAEKITAAWFGLDAFTHLTIELLYLFFATQPGGARTSSNPLSIVWKEYGRADNRWDAPLDPEVMSVELPTVLLMGPGALLCLYAVLYRAHWKNLAIFLVSWTEIVGGWYTFAPDWVRVWAGGPSSLSTADPYLFWILLVFMNGLWVVVPGILMYDSGVRLVSASEKAKVEAGEEVLPSGKGAGAYKLIAALLLAYSLLVPLALIMAKRS